ncbi:MAG: polysaccharide pyruvyl transferase family protein [Rhodocyclaceae bacterium]|nr:polysaccharide pyruvyl transferase family protein [Rhodocyclaceae bacterium]
MKLYYFKDHKGNFGDDLNPWLWNKLLPDFFDDDNREIFVGIGTLINHRLPETPIKHIFGSGYGYGKLPKIDNRYIFHAVRGYKTAQLLGVPKEKVITDSAILIRTVNLAPYTRPKEYKFGLMLTGHSLEMYNGWKKICDNLNFNYISCHWNVEKVLGEISACEVLITEAMHGAIVADALRIPWLPVDFYNNILSLKWEDWLSSIELPFVHNRLQSLYNKDQSIKMRLKRLIFKKDQQPHYSTKNDIEKTTQELLRVSKTHPFLSQDALLATLTDKYLDLLYKIRLDIYK